MQRHDLVSIREIISTEHFLSWYAELSGLQSRLTLLQADLAKHEHEAALHEFNRVYWQERADDALLEAAERSNSIDGLRNESVTFEDRAYRALVSFEQKREEVTSLWERIGVIEFQCDELPDDRRRERERARRDGELQKLRAAYQVGVEEKEASWEQHEVLWLRAGERALMVPERELRAQRSERRYAALSESAEKMGAMHAASAELVSDIKADLLTIEAEILTLRAGSQSAFSCLCHEDFLYWASTDDRNLVFVLALRDSLSDYNIEVQALSVYQCFMESGIAHLEPAVGEDSNEAELERLKSIFEGLVGEL